MFLHLIKWAVQAGEAVCRPTFFNRDLPEVGRIARDLSYGRDREQRLDVLVPPGAPPFPVLVYLHGGGWVAGDKSTYARICRSFAAEGFLVFNVNYRLWPGAVFPAPSQDVARAVRWAYDHAAEFGGDASRVFLAGDSAGAHMALSYAEGLRKPELFEATGVGDGDRRLNACGGPVTVSPDVLCGLLLFYGLFDVEAYARSGWPFAEIFSRTLLGSDPKTYAARLRVVSPIRHLSRELPPCFVAVGERDFLYDQSVALVAELKRLGAPHRALFLSARQYPTAWHAFLNFYRRPCARLIMREAIEFAKNA